MSQLKFYIRHQNNFLREKFILVFKSEAAKNFFENAIDGCYFEELTKQQAQHAARIGINGKVIPYGYTYRLTKEEMEGLSTHNWDETAELLAEGNERLYKELKEKGTKA